MSYTKNIGSIHSAVKYVLTSGDDTDLARTEKIFTDYHENLITIQNFELRLEDIVSDPEFGIDA